MEMEQSKLDDIVDEVARITGRNVTLDDVYSRVLAYNMSHPTSDRARIESVLMKSVSVDAQTWESSLDLSRQNKPFVVPPNKSMGFLARVCIPLIYRGLRVGYVWIQARDDNDAPEPILEAVQSFGLRIENFAYTVMEAVEPGSVAAESRERAFISFLHRTAAAPPEDAVAAVADGAQPRILVLSHPGLRSPTAPGAKERKRLARQAMLDALRLVQGPILWGAAADHAVVLVPHRVSMPDVQSMRQRFGESLVLHGLPKTSRPADVEAGMSLGADSAGALPDLYEDAVAALQARAVDPAIPSEADYGSIGIYQQLSRTGEGKSIRSSNLEALLRMPNGEEMLSMLERIYDFNGPRGELATELHIHRTSLYHRLRLIGEAFGRDPMDSFVRFDLDFAMKARSWLIRNILTTDDE
jgi:hypothetical protein